jgi:hypothetical protein
MQADRAALRRPGLAGRHTRAVEPGVETGRRVAVLAMALVQIVLERINAGRRDVLVMREGEDGIEFRDRAHPPAGPFCQEVREAVCGGRDAVGGSVPSRGEIERRPAAFPLAVVQIVQERVVPGCAHIRVLRQIPVGVEISVPPPSLAPSFGAVIIQRIDILGQRAAIGAGVPAGIKQPARGNRRPMLGRQRRRGRLCFRSRALFGHASTEWAGKHGAGPMLSCPYATGPGSTPARRAPSDRPASADPARGRAHADRPMRKCRYREDHRTGCGSRNCRPARST